MFDFNLILCGSIYADEMYHFYGQAPGKMINSPSYYALIRDGNENILVDSGFDTPEWVAEHIKMQTKAEKGIETLLAEKGLTPADIDKVVFTHLHWDHVGSIEKFTNAKFYCQDDELKCALNPPEGVIGYNPFISEKIGKYKDKFVTVHGDTELFPGVKVIWMGGHSVGSQAVLIETKYGWIAMPGDNIARYKNIEEGIPAGLVVNLQDAIDSVQRIKEQSDVILPSHDWLTGERHPELIGN